jgi:hypothetical protein
VAEGELHALGDTTTLLDPLVVEEIKAGALWPTDHRVEYDDQCTALLQDAIHMGGQLMVINTPAALQLTNKYF